jgi:type VI secretion system secreted protein Hcp
MFNAFVNFGDIKGECTDKDHKDWVMIDRYEHHITQPASVTQKTAGGRSAEAVQFEELKLHKMIDASSPKLSEACCKGTGIPEITIELWRAGGDPLKYYQLKVKDAMISSVKQDGSPTSSAQFPVEVVGIVFGSIEWTYTKQKPDGTAGGNVAGTWSLANGA